MHTTRGLKAIVAIEKLLLRQKVFKFGLLNDFLTDRQAQPDSLIKAEVANSGIVELVDVSGVEIDCREASILGCCGLGLLLLRRGRLGGTIVEHEATM